MTDHDKDPEIQTRSEEKQPSERPKVRLPFVSSMPGNAWAQMRTRERERREKGLYGLEFGDLGYSTESTLTRPIASSSSRPNTIRKLSGLNYDEGLALPMPKPSHLTAGNSSDPVPGPTTASKLNVRTKLGGAKKQAATEPVPAENVAGTRVEGEKKRSIVATLKSKLSFKELGKEFRKAQDPPLSAMPRLPPSVGNPQGEENKQSPPGPLDFDEEKLYVPKPRQPGVHPASAPAETTTFLDTGSCESSKNSASSCPIQQAKDFDKLNAESLKGVLDQDQPHQKVANVDPMTRLGAVLIDGSSLATVGESSRGHPMVVDAERRIISTKVENKPPISTKSKTDATSAKGPVLSIHNAPKGQISNAAISSPYNDRQSTVENSHPLIVSSDQQRPLPARAQETARVDNLSDQYSRRSSTRSRRSFAAAQAVPALDSTQSRPPFDPHVPIDDTCFCSGVTSHGGYAPPPPHPGYQNTVTLEQQIATYMDSIHIHVDGTANRLARTLENVHNWSADQIVRQIEALQDHMRTLHSRVVREIEEVQRAMTELQTQISALQREQLQMEDRIMQYLQSELSKLRSEINASASTVRSSSLPYNPAQDTRSANIRSQGSLGFLRWSKDDRQQPFRKSKPRLVEKDEVGMNNTGNRKGGKHNQNEPDTLNKHAEEQTLSDDVPTPTAAFRTPSFHGDGKTDHFTHSKQHSLEGSGKTSTESPEPLRHHSVKGKEKADNNHTSVHKEVNTHTMRYPAKMGTFYPHTRDESDNQSKNESDPLPPAQCSRDNKASENQNPKEQEELPTTPPMQTAPFSIVETARRLAEDSPSSIHPALRDQTQQQIMAERERLNTQSTLTLKQHLRSSRSYQDLSSRSRNAASFNWNDCPFGSPSASSSRGQVLQDLALGYTPLSAAPLHPISGEMEALTPFAEARLSQAKEVTAFAYRGPTPPPRQSESDELDLPTWYRAAYAYKSIEKNEGN
ncbi:uncharacterized protein BDW43DRAFT_306050 [Aspergillus alliaceus]|uniref:uncharacterized protein n=1 Tax=Petromyces alliaceus TaxID=209559 RepID=UPI0012A4204C|nr:uncharacterized protein BDW43DRAFT_306050 [Aspergillus alliaceus]KAB8239165.1 hypothetical protein BDW43DRAFT_306050 [Aspergillus alliaceus]